VSSCSKQENILELFNGIKEITYEEDRIVEYELYDVPGNESSNFQAFIRSYTQKLEGYMFYQPSKHWKEDNTELSISVETLMDKHKRELCA
jgi:hypothetical protein